MAKTEISVLTGRRTLDLRSPASIARLAFLPVLAALMLADMYLIFMWAPTDRVQGHVQRIFYIHIPIAWVAFLAFSVVFVSSIMYLWKRTPFWDALAHSCAEIGLVFATLILVTGSIWAKPTWGVWWTWDPKLTTSVILWLIYLAYLMLRGYAPTRSQGAIYAAVLGIVGFVDVPIVYVAVDWWRSAHPEAVVGPLSESGSLNSSMRTVLMFSMVTFTLLFVFLLRERLSLRKLQDAVRNARYVLRTTGKY